MNLDGSLCSYLTSLLEDTANVQECHTSEALPDPRVWFDYSDQDNDQNILLSGDRGIITTTFDIEIVDNSKKVTEDIARTIKDALNGFRGTIGQHFVQMVEVRDCNGRYEPKGTTEGDLGKCLSALSLEIIHSSF